MSLGSELLKNSRLAGLIGQVERGEPVDTGRLLLLQHLDFARAGQLYAIDAFDFQEEESADSRAILERLLPSA